MSKKARLPRGLTMDLGRYRVQFNSRHTSGKRFRERLPEGTTRRQAEDYLAHLREQDRLGELLWPSEREKEPEPQPEMPSVVEFAASTYIPYCRIHNSPRTVAMKLHVLERVAPWFGDVALDEVDRSLVRLYQQERKEEGVRARTVNLGWNTVRHLLNSAHSLELIAHPAPQVAPIPERDSKPSRSLSEEEAIHALEYASGRGAMWHALVLFLLHTGARWGETRQLRWADLDLNSQIVHLRAETAKQGRARDIPLVPEVVEALEGLPRGHELVFVRRHQHTGEQIPLHEAPRCLGGKYPWEGPGGELHIGPHTFRHTFATWRLRAGVSIAIVSRWLGHSTIQMTVDTYGHIEPADCVEEIGRGPRPQVTRLKVVG